MMQRLVRIQYKYINYKLNLVYSNGRQSNVYCLINNVYAEEECGGKLMQFGTLYCKTRITKANEITVVAHI